MSRGNSKGIHREWVAPNVGSQGRSLGAGGARSARARACLATRSLPIDDPNEQFNRGVLHVNQVVIDPAANVVKQCRDRSATV